MRTSGRVTGPAPRRSCRCGRTPAKTGIRQPTVVGFDRRTSCIRQTYSSICRRLGGEWIDLAVGPPSQVDAQVGVGVRA